MNNRSPFRDFLTSPEIIRLAVMLSCPFFLWLRNVEDLLHKRGIEINHETLRFWWNRFGSIFATETRKKRSRNCVRSQIGNGIWMEFSSRSMAKRTIFGGRLTTKVKFWKATLPSAETEKAALIFFKKSMKRYGQPEITVTDKLRSHGAAMKSIGNVDRQQCGRRLNNRAENSHQPFRRRERAMLQCRQMRSLQKFSSVRFSVYNHFNQERSFTSRGNFKPSRAAALLRMASALFGVNPGTRREIEAGSN